jgi:hypothetical protein
MCVNWVALTLVVMLSCMPLRGQAGDIQVLDGRWGEVALHFSPRLEPGVSNPPQWGQTVQMFPGRMVRILDDAGGKVRFAYELKVEILQPGKRLRLLFAPLSEDVSGLPPAGAERFRQVSFVVAPAGVELELGGVALVPLMASRVNGQTLYDAIRLLPKGQPEEARKNAQVARPFRLEDIELTLAEPVLEVDGRALPGVLSGGGGAVRGAVAWFYRRGYGRYVFSLAARPGDGFVAMGEVAGGTLRLRDRGHEIVLRCRERIAPADGNYVVYGRAEPGWRPRGEEENVDDLLGANDHRPPQEE